MPRPWTAVWELAKALDKKLSTVQQWFFVREVPNDPKLWLAIADFLRVDLIDLFSEHEVDQFESLKSSYRIALGRGDTLEIARLSNQVLRWTNYFTTGKFGSDELTDEQIANVDETERELVEMFLDNKG